jgi:DNA-binding GntR family transcriptional regulator
MSVSPLTPRDKPATDRAYDYTKDGITSGLLRGGDLISEGDVAQALQISRTPVREAFLRLASEGLLRLYPKRGALIVPVTPSEVSDVLTARQLIEPWSVAVATNLPRARRETLAEELGALLSAQRQALEEERLPDFHLADCEFHLSVVEAAGNDLLSHFYRSLRDRQLRMLDTATIRDPGRRMVILEQHQALLVAIREGKSAEAATTISDHLGGTAEAIGGEAAELRG